MARVLTIPGGKTDPRYFGKMVAFSLVMHVLFSLMLLMGHPGRSGLPTVQYIDLKMAEPAVSPSTGPQLVSAPPKEVAAPSVPDANQQEKAVEKPAAAEQAAAQPDALPPASFGFGLVNGRFGAISYDRMMLQTLKTAGPMSPLPDSYEADFFSAPLRFVGPLNLMSPFSG